MHWKTKSRIQNAVSFLPSAVSYSAYYWLQRRFGALRQYCPVSRLAAGIETWKVIKKLGFQPENKTFFEVGTGRVPITPLAFWLMGAKRSITMDLHPYMKTELINDSIDFMSINRNEIQELFGQLLIRDRLEDLLRFYEEDSISTDAFLQYCQIEYIAPGDAAKTKLNDNAIDFHTSYNVFEHIPPTSLIAILNEGSRITNKSGLFVHRVDYSDHFSHSDSTISAINFLQYSDSDWEKYAGNRYMYMNRLRHDDFLTLFESSGHRILLSSPDIDQRSLKVLKTGQFTLNEKFGSKSEDVLSTISSWLVSQSS